MVRALPPPLGVHLRIGDAAVGLRLTSGRCVVGAAPECDLVIDDEAVSRRHVLLTLVPEGVAVEDLGSRNGTYFLGQRIERAVLSIGSVLTVGDTVVTIAPDAAALDELEPDPKRDQYRGVLGRSAPMRRLFAVLARLEGSLVPVLIQGPSGVGKELIAKAIHEGSQVAEGPLVTVNCGALSRELVRSELFGHQKGAFTGATEARAGAFEAARGGTLFLDEIGELPLDVQPALLRALESGEVKRLGDDAPRPVDVRILAATNRNLADAIDAGSFREDLYFRIAVVTLAVPPLDQRVDDIVLLARHFASEAGGALPDDVIDALSRKRWRGNARELRNAVRAYLAVGIVADAMDDGDLLAVALRQAVDPQATYQAQKETFVDRFSRAYFEALIESTAGNISEASRRSGIDRSYLRKLLHKYEVRS